MDDWPNEWIFNDSDLILQVCEGIEGQAYSQQIIPYLEEGLGDGHASKWAMIKACIITKILYVQEMKLGLIREIIFFRHPQKVKISLKCMPTKHKIHLTQKIE